MINIFTNLINGKKVLILGFGKEGRSTYKLIKDIGLNIELGIADINPPSDIYDAKIYSGENYLDYIDEYDIAFKSPGIVLPKNYHSYSCKITSQTEIFLQAFSRQVIGITGTKGKSTVSSLLYHVLDDNHFPCLLAGNIGTPMFDIFTIIKPETIIILELSCHQLEFCKFSPSIAVLLNIYEDHLDHYGSLENYAKAKKNIYLHQHSLDILYCNKKVMPLKEESISRTIVVDDRVLPFDSLESIGGIKLRGKHNLSNCAFVYSIAKSFGITNKEIIKSLKSYTPLHHRLEFIGNKDGVDYYDDSISTTVESAINAIESIPNASTILLGGMDRGIDYTSLINYIYKSKLSNVICMYQSGKRIYKLLKTFETMKPLLFYCNNLFDATELAQKITKSNMACILSPASASYGDFQNFEERGNIFKTIIFSDKCQK